MQYQLPNYAQCLLTCSHEIHIRHYMLELNRMPIQQTTKAFTNNRNNNNKILSLFQVNITILLRNPLMLVFFLNSDLVDYMDDTINRREKIFISMKKFHSFGLVQFKFCCIFVALSFSKCTFWPFLDVCKIYTNKTIFI